MSIKSPTGTVQFTTSQPVTLTLSELPLVQNFYTDWANSHFPDPIEREFQNWNSSFRQESLEHYLKLGWSFGVFDSEKPGKLLAVVLAQPMLYFQAEAQQLWVEAILTTTPDLFSLMCELMIKISREKHFQFVQFRQMTEVRSSLTPFPITMTQGPSYLTIKTTK